MRYIDDIFAVFDKYLVFQPFLDHINNQSANIKFNTEECENNVLSFWTLGFATKEMNSKLVFSEKSTNIDALLNFSAMFPVA